MKVSYSAKAIKSKLKTYCSLRGLVYDDGNGATRKWNGESKRWIQVTNQVTKVTEKVTEGDDKDTVPVTFSADDPLFGDFSEVTEECNGNSVTGSGYGNKTVTSRLVENEGLMENCNCVTRNYYPLYKKEEDENIYKELKNPVTSVTLSPGVIKTHKLDENGNIILED